MRIVNDLLYFVKCKYCRLYFLFCNILQYSFDFNPFSVFRHGTQIEIRPTLLRRCRNRKSACGSRQDRAVGFRRKPRDFSARRATWIFVVRSFGKSAHSYRRWRRFLSGGHGINARLATSRRLFKRARPQKTLRIAVLARHCSDVIIPAVVTIMKRHEETLRVTMDVHASRDIHYSKYSHPFDVGFGTLLSSHDDLEKQRLLTCRFVWSPAVSTRSQAMTPSDRKIVVKQNS